MKTRKIITRFDHKCMKARSTLMKVILIVLSRLVSSLTHGNDIMKEVFQACDVRVFETFYVRLAHEMSTSHSTD